MTESSGPDDESERWVGTTCGTSDGPHRASPAGEKFEGTGGLGRGPVEVPGVVVRPVRGWWIAAASWAYAIIVLGLLALIHWVGDGWWGVTVLLFVPRWLLLIPALSLALASGLSRRPSLWAMQGTIALVVAGPLMGLSIPLHPLVSPRIEGPRIRVLSYNTGGGDLPIPGLIRLIDRERIDAIAFQETGKSSSVVRALSARGWSCDRTGALASRYPIVAQLATLEDDATTESRFGAHLNRVRVRTPQGTEFILASVQMPTLRPGFYQFLEGDISRLQLHIDWWRHELARVVDQLSDTDETPLLVAGDFNMPSDDSSMAALREYLRFGFEDAGWGYGYTRPSKTPWVRIDHILASSHWVFARCWVGPDLGSDHLPVMAEAVLPLTDPQPARRTP